MNKTKIILVEDDKMLCTIFEMFISEMGHDLIGIYQDAETAIENCRETKPDIAILDIHIGGELNGIEAAKIIQQDYKIPIIFLSGDAEEDILSKANEIKCKVFIEKPAYKSTLNIGIKFALLNNCFSAINTENSYKELNKLINNLTEPALIIQKTKIIQINENALNLLKFSSQNELIGKDINDIIAETSKEQFQKTYSRLSKHRLLLDYFKVSIKNNENECLELGATLSFIQNVSDDIAILNIDKV